MGLPYDPESGGSRLAAPNFDRLARIYRWMEWASFGPLLGWCRCAFLGEMRELRRALVIGDGDGRFTARLLAANGNIQVDAVDASPAMLRALERRAGGGSARLTTQCMDARDWRPSVSARFDLVVTHFFLDCLTTEDVRKLAGRVRRAAAPNAVWVVSEFAVPENGYGRFFAGPLIRALYWAFELLTGLPVRELPDHASALKDSGFVLKMRRSWLGGLLVSEWWVVPASLWQAKT